MSRKDRKFKGFFRPKLGDLQKKKKKKGLRQNSGRFFSQFRKFKRLRGGYFRMGGGYFPFFTENRPQKHKKHAFLHTSQANGGGSSPPRPHLATLLLGSHETRIVKKGKALKFQNSFCPPFSLMVVNLG